jgi:hypothetical protein
MISFEDYAKFLEGSARRAVPLMETALHRVGDHALSLAKEYVGHDSLWRPLSPDYVSDKKAAGLTGRVSATDTWLLTGETLKSLAVAADGHEVVLGATTDQALWNEIGTAKMKPRPLLAMAMNNATDFAEDEFYAAAVTLLVPPGARRP